ncbi:lipid II flippase MurJ [Buchananella felis]|uniref:lipid II flippase MurJ n=1 Tax=Buchananella felis TaxID=3231492 RepID=UPI0035270880
MSQPERSTSLARSSTIMFSGTLVSRVLGFIRNALLVAVIGVAGANDAFTVANTLPNTVFNLLAGGVLNAILVPQIIRALRSKTGGEEYVNRLLTVTGAMILGLTVLSTAFAPLLVRLFAGGLDAGWFNLAVVFAYWCLPQVFFYGVFALLSQVLNAKNSFGWPMWAPAINNVVGIAGLLAFLFAFGRMDSVGDPTAWGTGPILVLAGSATLGVIVQALVLIPPLRQVGFTWKIQWGTAGLGRASRVAMWAFAALLVGQVGYIGFSRVASSANAAAVADGMFYPSTAAYTVAFMLSILPQSLITTSIVTAMFTRMSDHAAADDSAAVNKDLELGLRTVGVFTVLCSAGLVVLALPLVQAIAPTLSVAEASGVAMVLAFLSLGIVGQGGWTMAQRVLFAYEDTRTMFLIQIPMAVMTLVGAYGAYFLLSPKWWVVGGSLGDVVAMYLGTVVGLEVLRRTRLPQLNLLSHAIFHGKLLVAVAPAALVGYGVLKLIGVANSGAWLSGLVGATAGQLLGALWRLGVVAVVMTAVYVAILLWWRVPEISKLLSPALAILGRVGALLPGKAGAVVSAAASKWRGQLASSAPVPFTPGPETLVAEATSGIVMADLSLVPRAGHQVDDRYELVRTMPVTLPGTVRWEAKDTVTGIPVYLFMLSPGAARTDAIVAAATRATALTGPSFLRVYEADAAEGFLVTEPALSPSLARTLATQTLAPQEVRELVIKAAGAMHQAAEVGVGHGTLSPRDIYVSEGELRIGGMEVRAAATGVEFDDAAARQAADVRALAEVAYLCLTRRWPGTGQGFVRAPRAGGLYTAPSTLVDDVPADLDEVVTALVNGAGPRSFAALLEWFGESAPPAQAAPEDLGGAEGPGGAGGDAAAQAATAGAAAALVGTAQLVPVETAGDADAGALAGGEGGAQLGAKAGAGEEDLGALGVESGGAGGGAGVLAPPPPAPPAPSDGSGGAAAGFGFAPVVAHAQVQRAQAPTAGSKSFFLRRVNPTPVVLAVFLVFVVAATVWAYKSITAPPTLIQGDPSGLFQNPATVATASPGQSEASAAPAPAGPAQVVSAAIVDPGGDGDEHPELVANLFDGDEKSEWYSRFYQTSQFGGLKQGFGIELKLAEPRKISAVSATCNSEGGLVQVLVGGQTPADAKQLAQGPMKQKMDFTFEPTEASSVVIWISELPTSLADGKLRAEISEIVIR